MGDGNFVTHFHAAVVGVDFANQHGSFMVSGAGDNSASQQPWRNAGVGLVLFPDGNGIAGTEFFFLTLVASSRRGPILLDVALAGLCACKHARMPAVSRI